VEFATVDGTANLSGRKTEDGGGFVDAEIFFGHDVCGFRAEKTGEGDAAGIRARRHRTKTTRAFIILRRFP
jgi:hypothetical protein